ncbi:MAG: minor capsid protein [Geobacteraceae bacterium]|nr:minor capsid protein [Geobacteraceae bacterium]
MSVDLAYAFGLPPEKAIEYFQSKGFKIGWDWHETLDAAHAKAFTVAKVMSTDVLVDIRSALDKSLENGTTLQQFKKDLIPTLKQKGWWGEIFNEKTGEIAYVTPRRLDTIYQANLQSAYMAGRYQSMQENAKNRPYWMYISVLDGRTRPAHRALHGKVFRCDDPIWSYIYPPNGFRCRCYVIALTAAEVAARGLKVESSAGNLDFIETPITQGKNATVARYRGVDEFGKEFSFSPDPGWNSNPGASSNLAQFLETKLVNLPATMGADLFAEVATVARKSINANYEEWLAAALNGSQRRDYALLGSMGQDEIEFLKLMGKEPETSAIVINDRLVAGKKATRHVLAGNALTEEEWKLLPEVVSSPEIKLYDKTDGKLLYVYPSSADPRKIKIVVKPDVYDGKLKKVVNEVNSVFKVDGQALEDRTRYEEIKKRG